MNLLRSDELVRVAETLVVAAKKRGVDVAEAQARAGWELSAKVRLGETELVQEAGPRSVYLRVFRDARSALTSTSDMSAGGLERCVEDAIELLALSEADPFAGPAAAELLAKPPFADLELYDPEVEQIDAATAVRRACEAEAAALRVDPRLTLSEGATFSRVTGASALVLSSGFVGEQLGSYVSVAVAPVAMDEGGKRRRGHYWAARRHLRDLESEVAVGQEAARRTLRQLGARKVKTTEAPVVFEQDIARSIVGTFAGCILGGALWRKNSYLLDRLGTAVASPLVSLIDDPLLPRAPGSRVFDGDGLPTRRNVVVQDGKLQTYLLDTYSARKMGLACTHSASRGGASVSASTSNLIMKAGALSVEELIRQTERGLYVTDMMGFGFNAITGDYSRGASGFWIENGELAYPVSEVTVSGNLDQMLKDVDAVANDIEYKTSIVAPTFRVSKMTIGGE
jgi:PmbA protein